MLKLAEMCRKLETEHEKVVPFLDTTALPSASQDADEMQHQQQQSQQLGEQAAAGQPVSSSSSTEQEQPPGDASGSEQGLGTSNAGAAVGMATSSAPRLSAVGLGDEGKEVEEWDYLNR